MKLLKTTGIIYVFFALIFVIIPAKQCNAERYYPGAYEKKIDGTWYTISMNEFTYVDSEYVGCFYLYKSSEDMSKTVCSGSFYRISNNKYCYDDKYGSVIFKVKKKKIKVTVKGMVVKDFDFSGTYKLTERYHPS